MESAAKTQRLKTRSLKRSDYVTAGEFEQGAVERGEYRLIHNARRRRKLANRGEHIWWSRAFNCWVWDFWKLPF